MEGNPIESSKAEKMSVESLLQIAEQAVSGNEHVKAMFDSIRTPLEDFLRKLVSIGDRGVKRKVKLLKVSS